MSRTLPLRFAAAALAVAGIGFAGSAAAQPLAIPIEAPLFIAWNSCYGSSGAANDFQYACDGSLDGNPRQLVISFQLPQTYNSYSWDSSVITLQARTLDGSPPPDYWRVDYANAALPLHGGRCRRGLQYTPTGVGVVDATSCSSWSSGKTAFFGISNTRVVDPSTPDRVQIEGVMMFGDQSGAVTFPKGATLSDGAFLLDLASDGCGGCDQKMVIELQSLTLENGNGTQPSYILTPGTGSSASVTWQGGGSTPVPVRNRTWGSVKSLYR